MPELPEVETTRCGIAPHIVGKRLTQVIVRQPSLRWPIPSDLSSKIQGAKLVQLERRGKYLLFFFSKNSQSDGGVMLIHLGMSGNLQIMDKGALVKKHDHVDFHFAGGKLLRYTDPRRFGCVLWAGEDPYAHALLSNLGPEPLLEAFTGEYLYERSRKRKVPIKTFIMDSKIVVGVGNIYANEALFLTGIRPTTSAGKVSKQKFILLANNIVQVLSLAIKQGGTTLKDFVGGDGKPGYFKQELKVYGRGGEACVFCNKKLKEIRLGQRSTVYCTQCQT